MLNNKKFFLSLYTLAGAFLMTCPVAVDAAAITAPDPDLQHNFTFIQPGHLYNLNPHTASYSSEAQILNGLFDGLFSYDPETLDPVPALAETYHISRNKLRWTFILRDKIEFSNANPITANDVRESWLDLLSTKDAPYASLLDIVTGAKAYRTGTGKRDSVGIIALDDKTIVVKLEKPASHLLRILCHHAFAIVNKDPAITSGAFVLAEQNNQQLILKKNENYWDSKNVYLPQITILQSDNSDENTYMFNTGKADWVANSVDIKKMIIHDAVQIHAEYGTQYLFFKCRRSPWDNPDFRNSLLAAVPWKELRKSILVPATTFVYPLDNYPEVTGFDYTDKDEAHDLMEAARKKAGIASDKDIPLIFAIIDTPYMENEAELLKKAWQPLGVTVTVQKKTAERYLDSISSWDADMFSYTWIGDFADPLAFLELFRGGSTLNPSLWQNKTFDDLLDQAAATLSNRDHLQLLSKAEQLLLDSGVVLPISHPVSLQAIDLTAIGGWRSNALDLHPFRYLYFKRRKPAVQNIVMR